MSDSHETLLNEIKEWFEMYDAQRKEKETLLAKVDELEKKLRSANNLINLFKDYKAALNKER